MATILITGGTGLIGQAVSKLLISKGHSIIILSRGQSASTNSPYSVAHWDPAKQEIDVAAIRQADYIINLAGAGVADKRWTNKRKQEIIDSRVQGGELLVKTLKENTNKVKAVISASGIGWYGDDVKRKPGRNAFTEDDPVDTEYLGETCRLWEASIDPVQELGKRLIKFRIGIVLSNEGGALKEYKMPVRFGVAAILGSGKQVISWIHVDDLTRLIVYAIEHEELHGVYNAVASQPVTNRNFMLKLAEKIKGRFYIPFYVPSFVLKLMLGGLSVEVLKSATVSNSKISQAGFQFLYPTVEAALGDLTKH
ncbi:MAG: TIGR01777 family oxidoreductase [Niastella sp.]|nr:TIGR01777 family oxidoreductase [Niastella sp.]